VLGCDQQQWHVLYVTIVTTYLVWGVCLWNLLWVETLYACVAGVQSGQYVHGCDQQHWHVLYVTIITTYLVWGACLWNCCGWNTVCMCCWCAEWAMRAP
jgi:putative effector of murein hydrolase LrgA (UPF0299 family)